MATSPQFFLSFSKDTIHLVLLQSSDLLIPLNRRKFLLHGLLYSTALPRTMSRLVIAHQNIPPVFVFHFQTNNNKNYINFGRHFSNILSLPSS
jgi:hypothetical protein